ncbi:MAG: hypothetical protein E6R03_04530 [Hyphomicrobiaceae bacterium]|nr:MAG: hypothetical protein E6R03_04530 [Hyphomicrobiaceae bacterium]
MGSKITYWKQMRGLLSTLPAARGVMNTANLGSGTANSSTFLRGDQTYATPVPGSGTITLSMLANMATSSLYYRKTAGTGAPEVNSLATLKADLGLTRQIVLTAAADETQIDTTPFATQTVSQQIWRNLAGTAFTWIDAAGRIVCNNGSWTLSSTFSSTLWSSGTYGWASTSSVTGTSTIETGIIRDGAAGTVALRVGTQSHVLRVYNTSSGGNYERGVCGWQSSRYVLGCEVAGTGSIVAMNVGLTGNSIGFYGVTPIARPTTAFASAAFVAGAGTAVNDASTFGGYTLKQIAQALQSLGLLT